MTETESPSLYPDDSHDDREIDIPEEQRLLKDRQEALRCELAELYEKEGVLKAQSVLDWARTHPESSVYERFEKSPFGNLWDDAVAAHHCRITYARTIIRIDRDSGARRYISLPRDRTQPGGGYRPVELVARDPSEWKEATLNCLDEIRSCVRRFGYLLHYDDRLEPVFKAIEKTIRKAQEEIDSDPPSGQKEED